MAVEVVAGAVVAHGGAGVGVAGGDLHVAGVEQDRPVLAPGDGPVDRPPDRGGSGTRVVRLPFPSTRRTRWPCSSRRPRYFTLVPWRLIGAGSGRGGRLVVGCAWLGARWARVGAGSTVRPGVLGRRDGGVRVRRGCRAWRRVQAVVRCSAQAQPGGIFRIRLRAWWTRRAGAEKIRNRSILGSARARSPSRAIRQSVTDVRTPGGQGVEPYLKMTCIRRLASWLARRGREEAAGGGGCACATADDGAGAAALGWLRLCGA